VQKQNYDLRKEIKISNISATADLKQNISLIDFNRFLHLSTNLDLYNCGYVKDNKMIGRVSVFRTGKLISVGTKSIENAKEELEKALFILEKHRLIKKVSIDPKIRNIVASTKIGEGVDLIALARNTPKVIYEPDQFGAVIKRFAGSVVGLIFGSGSVVIVGSKSYEELNSTYFDLEKIVKKYELS